MLIVMYQWLTKVNFDYKVNFDCKVNFECEVNFVHKYFNNN